MIDKKENIASKPFLRWAGGKRWLIKHIESIKELNIDTYYEPFLGGGSVFFNLHNYKKACLSDLNPELIDTYSCIRDNPEEIIEKLKTFRNTEKDYYKIRDTPYDNIIDRSAKFIFLNKTSFNGIYRVNKKGEFNVPYGFRKKLDVYDFGNIRNVSLKLRNTTLICQDFEAISMKVKKGDFVFLDPPYTVAHENNGFIHYNQKLFSVQDQIRLSTLVEKIIEKEAYYVLTNAKHKAVLEIYGHIDKPVVLKRKSTVGGIGARREDFKEYLFSNVLDFNK